MVDLSEKGSEAEDKNLNGVSSEKSPMNKQKKTCADCSISKTSLWRGDPYGPKSLCNCGIRSKKKRRAILCIIKGSNEDNKKQKRSSSGSSNELSLKQILLALGREVLMQRSSVERQRKKLGKEEQATATLMSLSYGSVYG